MKRNPERDVKVHLVDGAEGRCERDHNDDQTASEFVQKQMDDQLAALHRVETAEAEEETEDVQYQPDRPGRHEQDRHPTGVVRVDESEILLKADHQVVAEHEEELRRGGA